MRKDRTPIIVFVYNRLEHVKNCLNSLRLANGAMESEVYIFSDGPKKGQDENVMAVREFINNIELKRYFKTVNVVESEKNNGLAESIIQGVTDIVTKYGRCIVLEDDTIVAEDFLDYMNDGLEFYKDNKKIWSVAGMSLIDAKKIGTDVYFMGRVCSCAWATWKDRWDLIDWEVTDYKSFKYNLIRRHRFNEFGTDRSNMLDRQMLKKINSWAIRFDYAEFQNDMLTVYPRYTKVKDNGHDGSGTHFTKSDNKLDVELPERIFEYKLNNYVIVDPMIKKEYNKFFALRWQARLKRFILREIENVTGKKVFK